MLILVTIGSISTSLNTFHYKQTNRDVKNWSSHYQVALDTIINCKK